MQYLTRNKFVRGAYILAVLALSINAVKLLSPRLKGQARQGGPIPYSVTLQLTTRSTTGSSSPVVAYVTQAIRSDSSAALKIVDIPHGQTQRILNFSDGKKVTVNDTGSAMTTSFGTAGKAYAFQRDPSSKCMSSFAGQPMTSFSEILAGEELVSGYRTVKVSAPSQGATWWYALDYGCAEVKSIFSFADGQSSEKTLVSLALGEPLPELYTIPATYHEMSYSANALLSEPHGKSLNPACAEKLKQLDREYHAHRSPQ